MYDNFFKVWLIRTVLLVGALVMTSVAGAQDKHLVDSLKDLLGKSENEQKFDILFKLFVANIEKDNQSALQYSDEAYQNAILLGDSAKIVKAGRAKGYSLMKLGNLDEAISQFLFVLNIAKRNNNQDQIKFLLNHLALSYTYLPNYDKALEFHFQSLVIREQEGNKSDLSITYNNIGFVYYKLKDYERALEYFKKALVNKREAKDDYDMDQTLINIGLCYNELGSYDEAVRYLNEAFSFCNKDCSIRAIIQGHYGLGKANLGLKNLAVAEKEFQMSYDYAVQSKDHYFMIENLIQLDRLSFDRGDYEQALNYLTRADEILNESEFNELQFKVYLELANTYNKLSDFQKASFYQSKYISLKDSVYSDELIRNLTRVQTDFEERENKKIIADREEALARQRRFNIAVAIIAILAGLLVFVLYRSNQTKKKVNLALSDAKTTIEDQNKELTRLNEGLNKIVDERTVELKVANEALTRVNDELDNFIYKTSHDIRGPLASLKGMCNVALMDVKDPLALDYFRKLDATAERLNTILTRLLIINQINNSTTNLEAIDFGAIVDDVIVLEKKKGLPPRLVIRKQIEDKIVFQSDKELIRIILENLIDNAIKFYNDSERINPIVDIRVELEDDNVKIRVIDNGIGISQVNPDKIFQMFSRASERSGTGGIGLYLTKTATEKLGGTIDLRTTPEGLTEFFVKFSLVPEKDNYHENDKKQPNVELTKAG